VPFYSFQQTQLVYAATGQTQTISTTGTLYWNNNGTLVTWSAQAVPTFGIGQMVYNAPYGSAAYCYFDYQSYGTLQNPATLIFGNYANSSQVGIPWMNTTTSGSIQEYLTATNFIYPVLSNGTGFVSPYVLDANNNNTFDLADTFCKPTSFQIISAGVDGAFGPLVATNMTNNTQGKLYPSGLNTNYAGTLGNNGISYDSPPPVGGSADDDNVTNFCQKNTLEADKP
jgi:hypothetical protein